MEMFTSVILRAVAGGINNGNVYALDFELGKHVNSLISMF